MATPRAPERACLVLSVLCRDPEISAAYVQQHAPFSDPEIVSEDFPFDYTDYYRPAMGSPLYRRLFCYPPPFPPERLAAVKLHTNRIEAAAARELDLGVARPLNLDPGYLTLSKLVLASTKDHAHRVYLRDGIYAEVTLRYHRGAYRPWPWTYPDYASPSHRRFLEAVRERLLRRSS